MAAGRDMIQANRLALAKAVPIERVIDERGIKLRGRIERIGPCPVCGGTDRFGINIRKQAWNCRGCQNGGDVIALVQHLDRVVFAEAVTTLSGAPRETKRDRKFPDRRRNDTDRYERRQRGKAGWLWRNRQPLTGTPAEAYLRIVRQYRGLLPSTLAYLPPANAKHCPALIAAFGLPDEPKPGVLAAPCNADSVHLTLLNHDGTKAEIVPNKMIIGRPLGRPIALAPPNDLFGLAITEGIEDALSAHLATGRGAWAAGNAGNMPSLADKVPGYVEAITIFAHNDKVGAAGALALAEKLHARGMDVRVEGLTA